MKFHRSKLDRLFVEHAALSIDKQVFLSELVGEHALKLDLQGGKVVFEPPASGGTRYELAIQVLGTESRQEATWLWSWANPVGDIPPELTRTAGKLRAMGQLDETPELTEPELPLDHVDGLYLSLVACGMAEANAHVCWDYGDGRVYVLVSDPAYPARTGDPMQRIGAVCQELFRGFDLPDHPGILGRYLESYGFKAESSGRRLVATSPRGDRVVGHFDAERKLTSLDLKAAGER